MGLFNGRYVALMCLSFIAAFFISSPYKTLSIMAVGVLALIAIVLSFIFKRKHKKGNAEANCILITLCCAAFLIGGIRSYLSIDLASQKALEHEGYQDIEITVISELRRDESSSEYIVNITHIGDKKTNIRAVGILDFSMELHSGDTVKARSKLIDPNEKIRGLSAFERTYDKKILLTAAVYDHESVEVLECGNNFGFWSMLWRNSGSEIIVDRIQNAISNTFDISFGYEISPLAKGFFMNDRTDIAPETIRDFKRCGATHLMAVSGMHITILLGAIDRFLSNLLVDKKIRCAVISVLSVGLLIITGFSSSASRAVIMLWITYIHFILADDDDSITALFFSVFIILMLSPYAYYDLGLWMSFLSTLGILCFYSIIENKTLTIHTRKPLVRILTKMGIGTLSVIILTLVANLFVLPISWSVFGEISLASVPANIVLSPISTVFLAEIPIALLLCRIPILGTLILKAMGSTIDLLLIILRAISKWDYAVQPLNYVFADIIIPILITVMIICIIIKLKYKWLMIIPPTLAAIAFGICLAITHITQPPQAIYVANGNEQIIVVAENGKSVICDISGESSDIYYDGYYLSNECGANKIDTLILAHLSDNQPQIINHIGRRTIIDKIWLPKPTNEKELTLAKYICAIADDIEAEVLFYNETEPFLTEENVSFYIDRGEIIDGKVQTLSIYRGHTAINFVDPSASDNTAMLGEMLSLGKFSIVSSSYGDDKKNDKEILVGENNIELLVFGSQKAYDAQVIKTQDVPIYVNKERYKVWNIAFSLE